jgi:multiple sugar transport system permease protein
LRAGLTRRWLGPALVAPAFAYIALLVGLPAVLSLYLSVSDARVGSDTARFVGLANFAGALRTPAFRGALAHSFLFTLISQLLVLAGATLLALSLKEAFRGRGLVRFLVLLPWVAPISLGAIGWRWLLDSLYSVINWTLVALGLVDPMNPPMWLGEPRLAMLSVILVHTWRTLPFATVILLAGLTSIPRDIPEAAAVDGGGFWRTHFTITLPMIRPIVLVAFLFGVIFTFTDMTAVYILTRGGPADATQVLPSLAFFTGILGGDLSGGAAISLFLFPLLLLGAVVLLRIARRSEVT